MKAVSIVIPLYKTKLKDFEIKSLKQYIKILGKYPTSFIVPDSLDIDAFIETYKLQHCKIERFDDAYFTSVFGYNELMLSEEFYNRFLDYNYMLIYQLDAYVFMDELLDWCDRGYHYIGAPWIATPNKGLKKLLSLFDSKKKKKRSEIFYKVGNGGFSLRDVKKHAVIAKEMQAIIAKNLKRDKGDFMIMEDVFWSIEVPKLYPDFKIPEYKEALGFAFDRKPALALKLNDNRLPFGCHGFEKSKVKTFWEDKIK